MGLFEVVKFEICSAFNIWIFISFLKFGKFTTPVSSNKFSNSFPLFLSGTSILQVLAGLMLSQRSQTVFIKKRKTNFFFFCCSDWVISITLSSRWLMCFSVSLSALFILSCVIFFNFSSCIHFWLYLFFYFLVPC